MNRQFVGCTRVCGTIDRKKGQSEFNMCSMKYAVVNVLDGDEEKNLEKRKFATNDGKRRFENSESKIGRCKMAREEWKTTHIVTFRETTLWR